MIERAMTLGLALGMILPATLRAQQNPALVGEGAQVYSANCGRCHNARASTERTDAQWIPIVMHMRARANLTKEQATAVLAYLQATNLPEGSAAGGDAEAAQAPPPAAPAAVMPAALQDELVKLAIRAAARRPDKAADPGGD